MVRLTVIFAFIIASLPAQAQLFPNLGGQRSGASALTFLKNDVSARSAAMGGASVAFDADPYSLFQNPAAAARAENLSISASTFLPGAGISQSAFSILKPGKSGSTFGFSVNTLSSGAMEVRTEFQPDGTGEYFYANNLATGLSFSRKLSEMFSFGITLKYIYEQLAQYKNHTASADLGFLYTTDFHDLQFAVMVQNFGGNSALSGDYLAADFNRDSIVRPDKFSVPTVFKLGFSMVPWKKDGQSLLASLQLDHPNDNAENLRIGLEYQFRELLFLRTGIKLNVKGQAWPTFGAGYRTRIGSHPLLIQYSALPTEYLGMQNVFGLAFTFNKKQAE